MYAAKSLQVRRNRSKWAKSQNQSASAASRSCSLFCWIAAGLFYLFRVKTSSECIPVSVVLNGLVCEKKQAPDILIKPQIIVHLDKRFRKFSARKASWSVEEKLPALACEAMVAFALALSEMVATMCCAYIHSSRRRGIYGGSTHHEHQFGCFTAFIGISPRFWCVFRVTVIL